MDHKSIFGTTFFVKEHYSFLFCSFSGPWTRCLSESLVAATRPPAHPPSSFYSSYSSGPCQALVTAESDATASQEGKVIESETGRLWSTSVFCRMNNSFRLNPSRTFFTNFQSAIYLSRGSRMSKTRTQKQCRRWNRQGEGRIGTLPVSCSTAIHHRPRQWSSSEGRVRIPFVLLLHPSGHQGSYLCRVHRVGACWRC